VNDSAPHILVVDDDARLRDLLARYLSKSGYRVSAAADAAEARARLASLSFDLLVVDVMMPGQTGTEFVADLRRSNQVPVLMLTALGDPDDRIKGLESGVDDYLAKPFEPRELLLRLTAILRRAAAPAPAATVIKFGRFAFDSQRGELREDGNVAPLTSAETALLRALARSPGVTVSRADLLAATGSGEGRAIDVTVTRLRRKIETDPKQPRHLQTVWGEGYVLWPD
jgi:two-component system phosphate regulon response regulator OmpR